MGESGMRAREQQFHNAWRASAVSQESAGTTTPSTREKKKELNDAVDPMKGRRAHGGRDCYAPSATFIKKE
jgi:hypothetical protein